jgi:hypothetical protein
VGVASTSAAGYDGPVRIRPYRPDDAPGVASLWQYWFRGKSRIPDPGLIELVQTIFGENPNKDPEVTPLVATAEDGGMLGFLGVTVTPVLLDNERGTLACIFPSVVDPNAPTTLASFLMRKSLAGPQVFTFSDGGDVKFERIWELLGGRVGQLQSLRWVRVFRPLETGVDMLSKRRRPTPLVTALGPVALAGDALARRARRGQLRAPRSGWRSEPLTPEALIEANEVLFATKRMRPAYSPKYLHWLFREMASASEQGDLTARLVRDEHQRVAGYYVYYMRRAGVCRVFALEAHDRMLAGVIDHLFGEADEGGAAALIGRLEPRLRRPMADRGCLIHSGGSLQFVHSHDTSVMDDALLGRLAFSRLDGENWYWWRLVSARLVPEQQNNE